MNTIGVLKALGVPTIYILYANLICRYFNMEVFVYLFERNNFKLQISDLNLADLKKEDLDCIL